MRQRRIPVDMVRRMSRLSVRAPARRSGRALVAAAILTLAAAAAGAATITVTGTGDTVAIDGLVTLREAITSINNGANVNSDVVAVGAYGTNDTIFFNIPGAGPPLRTIAPASALPPLQVPMTIDGYSEPGASVNTNGPGLGTNAVLTIQIDLTNGLGSGINITGSACAVEGLVINRGPASGITISGSGNTISGNFIGTDPPGTGAGPGNGGDGIAILSGANNNVIGGATSADRNVISANGGAGIRIGALSTGNLILGNLIGTAATGAAGLGDGAQGITVAGGSNTTIGGAAAGARNVISGNVSDGILLTGGSGNTVLGNYIGTDAAGGAAVANARGITVNATNNVIGGNLISGNTTEGIVLSEQTGQSAVVQNNLIGTNAAGTAGLGGHSTAGIHILVFASGNVIGGSPSLGNVIAFGGGTGVLIDGVAATGGTGNWVTGNSIYGNAGLGIKLGASPSVGIPTPNDPGDGDAGPNGLQNYPTITSATIAAGNVTLSGTLNSVASTDFVVDFYSSAACDPSGNGEGQTFLGSTSPTTDNAGNASFGPVSFPIPAGQPVVTATAIRNTDTSEFSPCFTVGGCPPITVLPAALPQGVQGTVYSQTLTGSGGTAPYGFTLTAGALPAGLGLSAGGLLSGTPTASGTFSFTVTATDANLCVGSRPYTLVILPSGCAAPPAPTLTVVPATAGLGQKVTLTWTRTIAAGQGSYTVEVRANNGGFAQVATIPATGTGFETFRYGLLGLPATYDFRILAVPSCNPALFSTSNIASAVETGPCPSAPAVTGVTVDPTSARPGDTVTVSWNGARLFSGSYGVFESTDGGQTFVLVAMTQATSAVVTVAGDPGSTLTFEVEALGCIYSQRSNFATVTVVSPTCDPPGAVSDIRLRASGVSPARPPAPTEYIAVDWQAPAGGTVPLQYSVRVNGEAELFVPGPTALLLPRGEDLDPIQIFVRAQACAPLQSGPESSSDPTALFLTPPQSSFTVSADPRAGANVTFTDTSSPQATSWFWIFDDGGTDTAQSPSHAFAAAGTHSVSLVASNGAGSSTSTQVFSVAPAGTSRIAVASPVQIDASQPGRRRARVQLSGRDGVWVTLQSREERETVVFLRLLAMDGTVRLERRLSVPAGAAGRWDVGAWGVTGDLWLELVSGQEFEAGVSMSGHAGAREVTR